MSDAMTCGYYPDDPLPGPTKQTADLLVEWMERGSVRPVDFDFYRRYTEKHGPPKNPILEEPMWFPGSGTPNPAWIGTSGMSHGAYA